MVKSVILQQAIEWMLKRNWKRLVAKRKYFNQSLFEHALVELDATLQILPLLRLPLHLNLTLEEEEILVAAVIAHDVGKERPEWQEYILGRRPFLSDIDPDLTRKVIPEICAALGFSDVGRKAIAVIENCVNLHMSGERNDTNVVSATLRGTDRWYTLANFVFHIDNICSARGVFEAKNALERSLLGKHLKTAYHQINIRGVSSTVLHRATLEVFQEAGWIPLLHFSDATLYVGSAAEPIKIPFIDQIENKLALILDEIMSSEVVPLVVGNEMQNFLPKPELFDYRELEAYLWEASKRANPLNFKKKKPEYRADVVKKYLDLCNISFDAFDSSGIDLYTERIGVARREMAILRFFKYAMSSDLIGKDGVSLAKQEYENIFGQGAWEELTSMSTYMPAPDMKRVDRFWALPGCQFDINVSTIEELASEERVKLLIEILSRIAVKVYSAISSPPTRATLAREMAAGFMQDLISPVGDFKLLEIAKHQMEFYAISKSFTGKQTRKARYLCPICNTSFETGIKARADFIDNPEAHTNRGVAHGAFGYVTICYICYYERILRQVLLGERAKELIVIFPRMNIGAETGELLVEKARSFFHRAYALMVADEGEPDLHLSMTLTHFIFEQILKQDFFHLDPAQLAELLTYRSSKENRRKNLQKLSKALQEAYGDDLEEANIAWGTTFSLWDEAVEAVYANKVNDDEARRIRAEVYQLHPRMKLVCQTPHMALLPLSYIIRLNEDSEANAALRRTFIAIFMGLGLDASVAIVSSSDEIDFQGGEGVAFVPPVASIRQLIGSNWVQLDEAERWLKSIGVASILADSGSYSKRAGLLEVLLAPTPGHVLRRIELKKNEEKKPLRYQDIVYLRILAEVTTPSM